jgi:hypothetical protein
MYVAQNTSKLIFKICIKIEIIFEELKIKGINILKTQKKKTKTKRNRVER